MNAIELISAGIGAMGAAGIVWAIAHQPATQPVAEQEPVEPPHEDDWQWDRPYTQRTETDSSFLGGDFRERR